MRNKRLTMTKDVNEEVEAGQTTWLNWCRLCAKRELNDEELSSIFDKDAEKSGTELATSVGKYFWVNIKAEDEIPQCLCRECKQLLEELVAFTERVNKIQTLFCLLQNIKPSSNEEANKFRSQFGIVDEGWEHIIKPQITVPDMPLLIDQQVQTEMIINRQNEEKQLKKLQASIEKKEVLKIFSKSEKIEDYDTDADPDSARIYEYVMNDDDEVEYVGNTEVITPNNKEQNHEEMSELVNEEEIDDIDLFKELKFKEDDEDEESPPKRYKIMSKEKEAVEENYKSTNETHEAEEEMEEFVEMLEEEDMEEENEDDYIKINITHEDAVPLELKGSKRGRPFGSKNTKDDSSYKFECKECKRKYKNPNIFRKHMLSVHNKTVDLPESPVSTNTCNVCQKELQSQSSLKLHMRLHLPDEEKYIVPCPYCDRKFSQVGAMKTHVNGLHHQMKPFICDQCGKACKTMAALTEHQLVHTTESPFECEVCHKRFKNKPRLKTHMDTHTDSQYKCPECDLVLNTKRTLLQHRSVHSDEKRFKCEFCDAAFKRTKALKNHLILHSGLRPYKCNFCNKSFANGSNCRAHKKRAHPIELAAEEYMGKTPEQVSIPKIEELRSGKGILVQPRKLRKSGNLPDHILKTLKIVKNTQPKDYEAVGDEDDEMEAENYETLSDYNYDIAKSEVDETESMVDNPSEECEETVIYEIIDEI